MRAPAFQGRVVVTQERFPIAAEFRIARGAKTAADVVVVQLLGDDGRAGRGECVPYARYGESLEQVIRDISGAEFRDARSLAAALPPGAARNALDCALWDLGRGSKSWCQTLGMIPAPTPTMQTLSIAAPAVLEARAQNLTGTLKLKLAGDALDGERVLAVRRGCDGAAIVVDANEGLTEERYLELLATFERAEVAMIEQPFPAGKDACLARLPRPIPIVADESCHDRASLPGLVGRYDGVNIKLDKTGGLTEAVATVRDARALGFSIMIGCMVSTSLSIRPALALAQANADHGAAEWVDLDGALLLARDREDPIRHQGHVLYPA